jgi:hypothetical protein
MAIEILLGAIVALIAWSFRTPPDKPAPPKSATQQMVEALDKMMDEKIKQMNDKPNSSDEKSSDEKPTDQIMTK